MVYKQTGRPSQKQRLLETAIGVVALEGVTALTIENLARAAGVTKGGVQYHFESKDDLITAILDFLLQAFDAEIAKQADSEANGRTWLRAYVNASLRPLKKAEQGIDGVAIAILAVLPPDSSCAEPFRVASRNWRSRCERGVADKSLAHLIRLAADSVWLERASGETKEAEIRSLRDRLLSLVESLT